MMNDDKWRGMLTELSDDELEDVEWLLEDERRRREYAQRRRRRELHEKAERLQAQQAAG